MTDNGYSDLHQERQRTIVYYWVDPDTGAALHHTTVNDDAVVPFFTSIDEAETYLEQQADMDGPDEYDHLSLYQASTQKQCDAVDVLTDQSGIGDFLTPD